MKKLKYFLSKFDGIWSVPLAFFLFFIIGLALSKLGIAAGTYDVGFIQPLFLAAVIVIGATNIAIQGLYFTFRDLHRFIYGYKSKQESSVHKFHNPSRSAWTKLTPLQQILIALSVFAFFMLSIIIVYIALI